ncbi:MAG TPA: PLP-dependent transferase, partial [Gemmatimonadaceae bacterium]|nr:PLP-dependent transferase [Gemmatimonadaceae bacterium]
MHLETLAVHAGHQPDAATGAVTPAIHLSTTFQRAPDGSFPGGHIYARTSNPNRAELEQCLAALEGGAAAAAFASGSAATMSLLHAMSPGEHVVAPNDAYYGTAALMLDLFARWGLEVSFADMSDLASVRQALRPNTRLVWIETPSNPLLRVTDIAGV